MGARRVPTKVTVPNGGPTEFWGAPYGVKGPKEARVP